MDVIPRKRNLSSRALTLNLEAQKPSTLSNLRSIGFDTNGVVYNHKISIDQVIECKRRASRKNTRPLVEERQGEQENKFSEAFYESIENYLDKHEMFVVDPTPSRTPQKFSLMNKGPYSNYNSPLVSEPMSSCSVKLPTLSKFAKMSSTETQSPIPYSMEKLSADGQKKSFLEKVCTSSLLKRRTKFETMDVVVSRTEQIGEQDEL